MTYRLAAVPRYNPPRPDPFGRLFGAMWFASILTHVGFFVAYAIFVAVTVGNAPPPPPDQPLVFDLADLPKGRSVGADPVPEVRKTALNPFEREVKQTATKTEDMPENVAPKPKVKSTVKQRSAKTRVQEELARKRIEDLRRKAQAGGGGEGEAGTRPSIEKLYLAGVREKIRSRWKLPPGMPAELRDKSIPATVKIDAAGNLIGVAIKSSGDPSLDASIRQAVSNAVPFSRPPSELHGKLAGGISFTFKPKEAN
ncbi:TonB C-terminal domain-containing protein [bacterium]|nr:TonB C-terminal domain-containing protein [bacterium]